MVGNNVHDTNTNTTTMDHDLESPTPATVRAPLLDCKLCELSFDTADERRQHAKSEWHVYKLRCKVAEPGTTITPPDSPSSKSKLPKSKSPSSDEDELDSDSDLEREIDIDFLPEECLFCTHISDTFSNNLTHMSAIHSLTIPYQSSLLVDLQTMIWFLHMVIFSYRECISCGKRKRSVEAVQAHMVSLGHCRFNVTEEMAEFYDMEQLDQMEKGSNPDERTLRLPSGKLLGHRRDSDQNTNRRMREKSPGQGALPSSSTSGHQSSSTSQALTTKKDRKDASLTTQLAGLSQGDQMSLVHLPESQQRSLLLRHKKNLDKAKRAERKSRRKLDKVGDKIAIHCNYYKQEVPIYSGG